MKGIEGNRQVPSQQVDLMAGEQQGSDSDGSLSSIVTVVRMSDLGRPPSPLLQQSQGDSESSGQLRGRLVSEVSGQSSSSQRSIPLSAIRPVNLLGSPLPQMLALNRYGSDADPSRREMRSLLGSTSSPESVGDISNQAGVSSTLVKKQPRNKNDNEKMKKVNAQQIRCLEVAMKVVCVLIAVFSVIGIIGIIISVVRQNSQSASKGLSVTPAPTFPPPPMITAPTPSPIISTSTLNRSSTRSPRTSGATPSPTIATSTLNRSSTRSPRTSGAIPKTTRGKTNKADKSTTARATTSKTSCADFQRCWESGKRLRTTDDIRDLQSARGFNAKEFTQQQSANQDHLNLRVAQFMQGHLKELQAVSSSDKDQRDIFRFMYDITIGSAKDAIKAFLISKGWLR